MVGCSCIKQACWSGAIVTTITTILVLCKCNREQNRSAIAIANMNAGPVQMYQTCMIVGTSLTDMIAGYV